MPTALPFSPSTARRPLFAPSRAVIARREHPDEGSSCRLQGPYAGCHASCRGATITTRRSPDEAGGPTVADQPQGSDHSDGHGIRGTARGSAPVPLSVLDLATVGKG